MQLLRTFSLYNMLMWIAFGIISGMIAHLIDPQNVRGGFFATVLIGVIGAMIGGFFASALFGITLSGFNITSFAVAIAGSLLVAFVYRSVSRNHDHIKTQPTHLNGENI